MALANLNPLGRQYVNSLMDAVPGWGVVNFAFSIRAYSALGNWTREFRAGLIEPETYNRRVQSIVNMTTRGLLVGSLVLPFVWSDTSVNQALMNTLSFAPALSLLSSPKGRQILMAVASVGVLLTALSSTIKSDEAEFYSKEIALYRPATLDAFSSGLLQTVITGVLAGVKRTGLACYLGSGLAWAACTVAGAAQRKLNEYVGTTLA